MKKRLLSLVLALTLVLGTMVIPAFASKLVTTNLITSIDDIQFGDGSFPTDGNYASKSGWATNKTADAFGEGTQWLTKKEDGTLVFNTANIGNGQSASLQHLIDGSAIGKDEKIILSFDALFSDISDKNYVYFSVSFNGDEAIPLSYEAYDAFPVLCASKKGAWAFAANKDVYPLKAKINDTVSKYSFKFEYTWNESAQKYDLTYATTPKFDYGKIDLSGTIPATAFTGNTLSSPNLKSIELDLTCINSAVVPAAENIIEISNLSLTTEKTVYENDKMFFSDASYTNPSDIVNDNIAEKELVQLAIDTGKDQYANISDANVLAGEKWHTNDNNSTKERTFLVEGDWIMIRPFQTSGRQSFPYFYDRRVSPKLVRCFTPVTDGSQFEVKSIVMPLKTALPRDMGGGVISQMPIGFNVQLRLTNDEWNGQGNRVGDSSSVFNIFSYGINQEEKSLAAVAGTNQTALNVSSVNHDDANFAAKTSLSYDIDLHNKEINVVAKFIPVGDNYNVYVTCQDVKGNTLLENTEPVVVSKETVADYNRFQISATFDDCVEMSDAQATMRYFGIKDLAITKVDTTAGLKSGSNTIYIPYNNIGDKFNAVVVAAIYDKDDNLVKTEIELLNNVTDKNGNVTFNLDITDSDNQYVKYFVFDNLDNLTPLKKNQKALTANK